MSDCVTGYTWKNSSQTLTATPGDFCRAASRDDLIAIVEAAVAKGQKVRVAGGGHSWYPLVLTDEAVGGGSLDDGDVCLVDVSAMTAVTKEETSDGLYLVHVEPGATMGDLASVTMGDWPTAPAPAPLVALPTNGVIPTELQLGGFVSAGCHGTGWEQPTVPDLIHELEMILVGADGSVSVRTFSEENPDDPMDVVRVGLGTIGVVSRITFRAQPLFCIHGVDTVTDRMSDVVDRQPGAGSHALKDLVEGTDYLELFWFPFNESKTDWQLRLLPDLSKTRVWKKMGTALPNSGGAPPADCPKNVPSQVWDALETKFGAATYTSIAQMSSGGLVDEGIVEGLLKLMSTMAYDTAPDDFVAPATRFHHYQQSAFPVLDFSFAIPMDPASDPYYGKVCEAWYAVVDAVADWAQNQSEFYRRYPVNVALHARFIRNSQALLSPAYQPAGSDVHTCWIEFLSGAPTPDQPDQGWYRNYMETWAEFCRLIGPKWLALGGRPHWAKQWQLLDTPSIDVYGKLQGMYGDNLAAFKKVRDELDPTGTFLYSWTERIFEG